MQERKLKQNGTEGMWKERYSMYSLEMLFNKGVHPI